MSGRTAAVDGYEDAARSAAQSPITVRRRRSAAFAFRGTIKRRTAIAIAVGASLLVVALWESSVLLGWVNPIFLPPPTAVLGSLWQMLTDGTLIPNALISIYRVWVAFLVSFAMAVPIGMLMSSYRPIGAALEPLIDFVRYLPVPALVPLGIIWFGVGEETKIFLLWLGTFFQLVLMVADDMRQVPQEYIESARTLGARPTQILTDVAFRAMLPRLLDSSRITLGWCWTYLVIAEIVAADSGLGYVIWTARRYMQTSQVMAGVVVIGLIGLVTDQLLRAAHRRFFRYL
jgi:NitT/TauT family transport system permease protein